MTSPPRWLTGVRTFNKPDKLATASVATTLLRAAKFLPLIQNGYRANVFRVASMLAASSYAGGEKSVGREKNRTGA
jgi:hypothetical protein